MVNKSLCQILEGQEALLNSAISSLDLNETNSRMVRPILEYLKQDIRAHLLDLQGTSSIIPTQVDLVSAAEAQWDRIDQLDKRLSKVEVATDAACNAALTRMYLVECNTKDNNKKIAALEDISLPKKTIFNERLME